jgi:hypothetical protein
MANTSFVEAVMEGAHGKWKERRKNSSILSEGISDTLIAHRQEEHLDYTLIVHRQMLLLEAETRARYVPAACSLVSFSKRFLVLSVTYSTPETKDFGHSWFKHRIARLDMDTTFKA